MKIIDLLDDRSILLDGRVADKKAALDQMVELMDASGKLRDKETYRQGVYAREQEGALVLVRELLFHIANRSGYQTGTCSYG